MLNGKITLVTGASRGLGAGIAREVAAQGAHVILAARTRVPDQVETWGDSGPSIPGSLEKNLAHIQKSGGQASAYAIDLLDTPAIGRMVSDILAEHGRIDILVNCAMGFPDSYSGDVLGTGLTDWQAMMDIGVRARYALTHAVSKGMKDQRSGLIANISAGASKDEYYNPIFRMAMACVDRMTSAIAFDLKPYGVSAVSVWPRWVRTERVMIAAATGRTDFAVSAKDLKISDSAEFTGRAIAHLASDPDIADRSGGTYPLVQLSHDYGFTDIDGMQPELDEYTRKWAHKLDCIRAILAED